MMKLLALASLTACVSTGTLVDTDHAARARVQLAIAPPVDRPRVFPMTLEAAVPRVDRIGREVRGTLGETATAALDLCVSLDGRVTRATLVTSSTFAAFDRALLADVADWRFAARPGPSTVATCARATIMYRPY